MLQEYAHRVALNQKAIIYDYTNTLVTTVESDFNGPSHRANYGCHWVDAER